MKTLMRKKSESFRIGGLEDLRHQGRKIKPVQNQEGTEPLTPSFIPLLGPERRRKGKNEVCIFLEEREEQNCNRKEGKRSRINWSIRLGQNMKY